MVRLMENSEYSGTHRTRTGAIVVVISLMIGIGPFVGKAYLRTTIPRLRSVKVSDMKSERVTDFLMAQMNDRIKEIRSEGEQLAMHSPQSREILLRHHYAMDALSQHLSAYSQSMQAAGKEQCQPYVYLSETVTLRESALLRAKDAHQIMMTIFTAIAGIFLLIALRSERVPEWAKRVTVMAFGAVIAGWFPL